MGPAVYWVREGMDHFGEFRVATHAVAVASDVDDVALVEQAVEQRCGRSSGFPAGGAESHQAAEKTAV